MQPPPPPLPPPSSAYPLPPTNPPTRRRGGGLGCVATGCVVLLVLGLLGGALVGGLGYWAWNGVRGFTDDHPQPVPILEATDTQAAAVAARLQTFADAVGRGQRATLTLSAADLNAVVARDPRYRDARGRVFFAIVKDALHTRVSVPLDGIPTFRGRWFNGEAGLDVRFADGELTLKPVSLEVRGKPVSPTTLRAMSAPEVTQQLNESLRDRMRRDPKFEETMRKVESVEIKDNKLVIVSDGGGGGDGSSPEEGDEADETKT